MIFIEVDGTEIVREFGSVVIHKSIMSRSTAEFTIVDETGAASYYRGQAVDIRKSWLPPFFHLLFSGFIASVTRQLVPGSTVMYHHITCMGNTYLADKRRWASSYETKTAGFIVEDMLTEVLADEGITELDIQTGPTFDEVIINYAKVSDALDRLAAKAGFIWDINDWKELFFGTRDTIPAPFDLDVSNIKRLSPLVEQWSEDYRNRQYLRGGRAVTALQTENYTGDGATKSFVVGYPVAQVPTSITVGGAPQTIGIKGIDTAMNCYWSKGDPVITWGVAPAGAAAIVIQYYGEYSILVMREDVAAIAARAAIEGGTGIVEHMADDASITTQDDAMALCLAMLDEYGVIGEIYTCETFDYGLEPGQEVTVTYPAYNLASANMLIESVEITEFAPGTPVYFIKAVYGPAQGDWTKLFATLAHIKDEIMDRLTIGRDEVLIILSQHYGDWGWEETITETVYACTILDTGAALDTGVTLC